MQEHRFGILEILGITIKNITTVLTIVSLESPAYSLIDYLFGNSIDQTSTMNEISDSIFD
jgi:hypothetical protein